MLTTIPIIMSLCGFFAAAKAEVQTLGRSHGQFGEFEAKRDTLGLYQSEAVDACRDEGLKLVDIETEGKWKEIETLVRNVDVHSDYWTGALYTKKTNKFFWSSGIELPWQEPHKAKYWVEGQPNAVGQNQDCVLISWYIRHGIVSSGEFDVGLNDWDCERAVEYYLCEKSPTPINPDIMQNIYATLVGKYTFVSSKKFTYFEAKLICEREGLELVSIKTRDEWREIQHISTTLNYSGTMWTHGNALNGKKYFEWSNGIKIPANAFDPGKPAGRGNKCAALNMRSGRESGLADDNCNNKNGFVCQAITKDSTKPGEAKPGEEDCCGGKIRDMHPGLHQKMYSQ